jgi:hypothetical protein
MKRLINKIKSILNPQWNNPRKTSKLNLLTTFSTFKPHGNQSYESFVPLIIQNINEVLPKIAEISELKNKVDVVNYLAFFEENKNKNSEIIKEKLIENFNLRGSDKVSNNYHIIYSCLLKDLKQNYTILEIGLGTNNPKIVSSMGIGGSPGASVRAFRDTFLNSYIYGADVDSDILFSEERISTFCVDQNNLETFSNIPKLVDSKFDLIIDDGLHYQLSNLNTLIFALSNLNIDGYFIIEDIGVWTIDTWKIVKNLVPDTFESRIIQMTESNFIFLIKKIK